MQSATSKLAALSRVFRFEYILATLPGMSISFFLCAESPRQFLSVPVLEGLSIIAALLFGGMGANAVIDREIDAKYDSFKRRIPEAVATLGVRRVWWIVWALLAIALVLALHLGMHFQNPLPLYLTLLIGVFGYGYSLPPLQLKLRGVLPHGISLLLASGVVPFSLSAYTYLGSIPASLFLFIAGFSLVQFGFEYSNQALDYLQDRREGQLTPAVRLGVAPSLFASLAVPLVGMLVAFAGLYWWMQERFVAFQDATMPLVLAWMVAVVAMLTGYFLPMRNGFKMYKLCRAEPPELCVPKLPAYCDYASWQASSVAGVAVASAIVFATATYLRP